MVKQCRCTSAFAQCDQGRSLLQDISRLDAILHRPEFPRRPQSYKEDIWKEYEQARLRYFRHVGEQG